MAHHEKVMDAAKSGTRPYRLGAFVDGVGWVEHTYGRVYEKLEDRIVAAPDRDQVSLILKLAEESRGPFQILYFLLVPRDEEQDEGRFELTEALEIEDLSSFLLRYRELFENDGRHHLWIKSSEDQTKIVYDQHNVLYIYGRATHVESVLREAGLSEGTVVFPSPHSHHYHAEHDHMLEDMLERYEWHWYPALSMG